MKEATLYFFEGAIIGFIGAHPWEDFLYTVFVAAVCGVVTLVIQFFGKKLLNSFYNRKLPKFKQNGKS